MGLCWREPLEGSSSTPVINEISNYRENKRQRKEPTTITGLSHRKDISVIVGSTENNSSVTGAAGTGGGNHTRRALLQIHRARQRGSYLPKNCWQHSWRRIWVVQRLWMASDGLCCNKICGFSAPSLKNTALGTAVVSWDRPLHTPMVSALLSSSGRVLHTQTRLHTTPRLHHAEHLALIAFNTHRSSSQPRTSQMVGPPMLPLSHHSHLPPDALGAEVPPVFPIKANFSENKYITPSTVEHPNVFALTCSTLYKKGSRRITSKFFNAIRFSEDTRFSINAEFRI